MHIAMYILIYLASFNTTLTSLSHSSSLSLKCRTAMQKAINIIFSYCIKMNTTIDVLVNIFVSLLPTLARKDLSVVLPDLFFLV